jgi:putative restriction endonuclease
MILSPFGGSDMTTWAEAVEAAIRRVAGPSGAFTREQLVASELDQIVADVGAQGATPEQTLSRELQQLRDKGVIEFVDDQGSYRLKH